MKVEFGYKIDTMQVTDLASGKKGRTKISGLSLTLFNKTFNFDKLFGWRF